MVNEQFQKFVTQLGLRKQVAKTLWEAEVTSPQQLGSLERNELEKITSDPLLLNHFHPILHSNVIAIATADDPYRKAIEIIKSHAKSKGDGNSSTASDSVPSNAIPCQRQAQAPDSQPLPNEGPPPVASNPVSIGGNNVLNISGNFVQASILSGNTVFSNTDTDIKVSSVEKETKHDVLTLDPAAYLNRRLEWLDGQNFSTEGLTVRTADANFYANHRQQNDLVYETTGNRRALLINITDFSNHRIQKRDGAERDSENIKALLMRLRFTVESRFNKRAAEIKTILRDFAIDAGNRNADMVAVYIGSHGERDEYGNDTFLDADGVRVSFTEIKEMFSPTNSPHLQNKPKIFFAQFCRQNAVPPAQQEVLSDAIGSGEDNRSMDIVCAFATPPGNKAYRQISEGSWFVTGLCRVLSENAHDEDLLSMLTKVNNSVSIKEGDEGNGRRAIQISEVVHNLRKKIFFFPGV